MTQCCHPLAKIQTRLLLVYEHQSLQERLKPPPSSRVLLHQMLDTQTVKDSCHFKELQVKVDDG